VWAEFADDANATMTDSDNVLLAPRQSGPDATELVFADFVTEHSANGYPRLPILRPVPTSRSQLH